MTAVLKIFDKAGVKKDHHSMDKAYNLDVTLSKAIQE